MHQSNNALKTAALLGLLSAILIIGGRALAGDRGIEYGLIIAVVMNFASYFFSDKIALATSGAKPLTQETAPDIYARVAPLVGRLAQRMNIPMPKLYITPEPSPNAFATGRNPNHASVAFTQGILQLMDDTELEGVVAHELGHVLNRDILISSIAGTIAAAITALSRFAFFFGGGGGRDDRDRNGFEALIMMILGPIAAMMVQMAISRTREFSADATSAKYIGSPYPLIGALRKLDAWSHRIPMEATPTTQHLYIMKPLAGGSMMRLFSTHPSTEERIKRLEQMR
ncbi:MAG TPA: M48 family metalloprotease [Bryobacteraceae bacterium]|nr:M48 family metalloprotease [Bryobacteraceae bacterium]